MSGVRHTPESDIEKIRLLLDGYAPGFAFLKELLQNAHDACVGGEGTLKIAWHGGLESHSPRHELLAGPALVVVNDGPFDNRHMDGLMTMGLGTKGGEANSIGKFGLGIKSVFHVTEAFFFLESERDKSLRDILSPWGESNHARWNEIAPSDWEVLHAACDDVAQGIDR